MALSTLFCLALAGVAAVVKRRPHGLILGVLIALHAAINYRFEVVLNEFLYDPRVWGGVLGFGGLSLGVGLLLDPVLRRAEGLLLRALPGLALAGGVLAFMQSRAPDAGGGEGPSVLVISMDTTRPDRLSPYGHDIPTPHLQALADEGTTFTQAIANAPITEPSHLAMFTGIAPFRSGIVTNGTELGERPALIWRPMQAAGYRTAGFVAGFPLHGKYGWGQGMHVYDDDFGAIPGMQSLSIVKAWNQVAIKEHTLRERSAQRVLSRVLPWLQEHKDERFFAFIHFYDVHGPYESPYNTELGPPPTDGPPIPTPFYWPPLYRSITSVDWLKKSYDAEIRTVDDAIGAILDALGPKKDQTLIMVTADHGESFTEHDYYFDHGDNLYDPSLKVPWIVRYPGRVQAGQKVDCQVAGVDLAPTVLDFTGIKDEQIRDGTSRVAELGGADCRARPVISSTVSGRLADPPPVDHSLREFPHKTIQKASGDIAYYDLGVDPNENMDLGTTATGQGMGYKLKEILAVGGAKASMPNQDASTIEALKALGYMGDE